MADAILSGTLADLPVSGVEANLVFCDVFGTLYDEDGACQDVLAWLQTFRARGGVVVLVSNSAAPGPLLEESIAARGIARDAYDAAITSADLTRRLLRERGVERALHIGHPGERVLFDGLGLDLTSPGMAEIVVCTGFPNGDVAPVLAEAKARGLDLVCTNPDLLVLEGPPPVRFAGHVARAYDTLGGRVIVTGKPGRAIYEAARALAERTAGRCFEVDRILAIGDSDAMDIAGSLALGYAAMHVTTRKDAATRIKMYKGPAPGAAPAPQSGDPPHD